MKRSVALGYLREATRDPLLWDLWIALNRGSCFFCGENITIGLYGVELRFGEETFGWVPFPDSAVVAMSGNLPDLFDDLDIPEFEIQA